jgi:oligopeptide/dipeptide ABC transporter ATP-binding protein
MTVPLLELRDLSVTYPGTAAHQVFQKPAVFKALDGINLTLAAGEALGLIGESGSGKTTLGRAIIGLTQTSGGQISLNGTPIRGTQRAARLPFARAVQMVFQDPYGSLHPRQTIGQTLSEPLKIHGAVPPGEMPARVNALLERVGLAPNFARRYPQHFSGGQRQRIAIARAIANDPALLIADEPVSALDVSVQAQILNLLADLRRDQGLAMLFISHDLSVVRHLCDRIAVMYLGRIVEVGPTEAISRRPAHPYTAALLSAAPRLHATTSAKAPIFLSGEVPSHAAIPPGCAFHTRCWLYQQKGRPVRCRTEKPGLANRPDGRQSACFFPIESTEPGDH